MANGQDHNPLNADALTKLNQVLTMVPETRRLIAKTEAAGIPTGQATEENNAHEQLAIGLKKQFFPDQP